MDNAQAVGRPRVTNEQRTLQMADLTTRGDAQPNQSGSTEIQVVNVGGKLYHANARVKNLTWGDVDRLVAGERRAARAQGRNEGEQTGQVAGYAAGHAAGYNTGRDAGYNAGHAAGRDAGHVAGHAAGHAAGLLAAPGHRYAENIDSHTTTHTKLDNQKRDQNTAKLFAAIIATLALGKAAMDQVPALVGLNYCGDKISRSDEHLCKVTGHIAIATTTIAGASAILTLVAAWRAYRA